MRLPGAPTWLALTLLASGCPPTPEPPKLTPTPSATPPPTTAAPVTSATTPDSPRTLSTLEVTVRDERGRPVDGAVVWLQGEKPRTPPPTARVRLEQKDLEYRPSFVVARKGQTLEVLNLDAELHNVHSSGPCCSWNVSILAGRADCRVLDQAGESTFLCDIHSHMRCTVLVLDADFARTGQDGVARLEATPGLHKIQIAAFDRPRFRAEVTVAAGPGPTLFGAALDARPPTPRVQAPERLPWPVVAHRLAEALARAEDWARQGDATSARESADEASGQWYAGSGLYDAVRQLGRAAVGDGSETAKECAERLKSALRARGSKAAAAATAAPSERPALLEKLVADDTTLATTILELARALPRRDRPNGDHP